MASQTLDELFLSTFRETRMYSMCVSMSMMREDASHYYKEQLEEHNLSVENAKKEYRDTMRRLEITNEDLTERSMTHMTPRTTKKLMDLVMKINKSAPEFRVLYRAKFHSPKPVKSENVLEKDTMWSVDGSNVTLYASIRDIERNFPRAQLLYESTVSSAFQPRPTYTLHVSFELK